MAVVLKRLRDEPAAIGSLVTALATLVAAFGLELSGTQVGTITTVLTFIVGWLVRGQVIPAKALQEWADAVEAENVKVVE